MIKVRNIYESSLDFGVRVMREKRDAARNVRQALADAYKTTGAKLILNFGTVFAPVIEKFGHLYRNIRANEECDNDCAVQCWKPKKTFRSERFGFDTYCLAECGCDLHWLNRTNDDQIYEDA